MFFKIYDKLNPLAQKRVRAFKKIRRAHISLWVVVIAFTFSLFAEIIANSNPIMVVHEGQVFFPIAKTYKGTDFGGDFLVEPDYKEISEKIRTNGFIIEPPIWWGYNETNQDLNSYPSPPNKSKTSSVV